MSDGRVPATLRVSRTPATHPGFVVLAGRSADCVGRRGPENPCPVAGSSQGTDLPRQPAKLLSLAFVGPQQLAVGGSDNLIRLWDLSTGSEIGHLAGHEGSVAALVADRNMLISGAFDTTVRIWTIEDRVAGQPQRTREVK